MWQGSLKRPKKARGQISLLIVFSLLPMFTLMAFVINIGMLVHAKIMLQNSADLAAYAGAATQARLMTDISHLNYQMRQVYKKFIYKYYVIGNMSQKCFPRDDLPQDCQASVHTNSEAPFDWTNRVNAAPGRFPGVPAVCISLSRESNPCQLAAFVPVVQPPPCNAMDRACAQLQEAAQAIGNIQRQSCRSTSGINQEVLGNWLYATNYERALNTNANLQGLVSNDVGLVTEELMLMERIHTLQSYINTQPNRSVNRALANRLATGTNAVAQERTVLAYRTIANNLNSYVFDENEVVMSELWEGDLLLLREIKPQINAVVTYLDDNGPNGNCAMNISELRAQPYVGVVKQPSAHVHYAIKVTAKAKLLFNPFPFGRPADSIELTAYSAAMPFGSRIGPDLTDADFVKSGTASVQGANGNQSMQVTYPALKIDDTHTYESQDVLYHFYKNLTQTSATPGTVGTDNLRRGLHTAMLPDAYEIGRYNIPVDTDSLGGAGESHRFMSYYQSSLGSGGTNDEGTDFTFWAPYKTVDGADRFTDKVKDELDQQLAFNSTTAPSSSGTPSLGDQRVQLKNQLLSGLAQFTQWLQTNNRENVYGMPDPLSQVFFNSHGPLPTIPGKLAGPLESVGPRLATSFTTQYDGKYYNTGRDGYSVKLVPFKVLLSRTGKGTNDGTNWPAMQGALGGVRSDLMLLQH